MNPGQSVKDRAALYIIKDAMERGELKPGGTIVEGTAGNTGIGLARGGQRHGLQDGDRHSRQPVAGEERTRCGCSAPSSSRCRRSLQEPQQLREVFRPPGRGTQPPAARRRHLGQPVRQCGQPPGPFETTAEEIWRQTEGKVDAFICAVGSGGTLGGVSDALKARNRESSSALPTPRCRALQLLQARRAQGRRHLDHRRHRPGADHRQSSKAMRDRRGLPDSRFRSGADRLRPARARGPVPRRLERRQCRRRHPLGEADGARPHHRDGAVRLRHALSSKLFNPEFLREKDLPVPPWLVERRADLPVVFADPETA
jgi:cysteine synthase